MNEVESQAQELLRHKDWIPALSLFDQLLAHAVTKGTSKDRIVSFLLGRSECCLELGRHEAVVSDCRRIIKLLAGVDGASNNGARARRRLVHALFTLHRFAEAESAAAEWIASSGGVTSNNPEAVKMLERVRIVLQMANGQKNSAQRGMQTVNQIPRLEDDIMALDYRLETWIGTGLEERMRRNRKHPVELIGETNDIEHRNMEAKASTMIPDLVQMNHHPFEVNNIPPPIDNMRIYQHQIDQRKFYYYYFYFLHFILNKKVNVECICRLILVEKNHIYIYIGSSLY